MLVSHTFSSEHLTKAVRDELTGLEERHIRESGILRAFEMSARWPRLAV